MRVSRLDTSTESKQRLNDVKSWAWGEGGTKSRQLTLPEQWWDEMVRGQVSGDQTPPLLLDPFSSNRRSENVCTETEKRVRERRHVRNLMSMGSFGIVL